MAKIVLGLDIGGANLKAATSAGRALSVPFAVWKQPEKLSAELRKLIRHFPEADEIAATMTAELCDCYETKREGVRRIVEDLQAAAKGLPIRIWSTDGKFVSPKSAMASHLKVAAANWHALATFAGRYVLDRPALLIDIGTTTTDLIPIIKGVPRTKGKTDSARLESGELLYQGWRRTPTMAILNWNRHAAEYFSTAHDAYLILGKVDPDPKDCDTADGRPATIEYAKARLARMHCDDLETVSDKSLFKTAERIEYQQCFALITFIYNLHKRMSKSAKQGLACILSGSGEFMARHALQSRRYYTWFDNSKLFKECISLNKLLGPSLSSSAPAYAVATLAAERP